MPAVSQADHVRPILMPFLPFAAVCRVRGLRLCPSSELDLIIDQTLKIVQAASIDVTVLPKTSY